MLITDSTICNNCNKEIHWYYLVPQKITSRMLEVDKIPSNKEKVFKCTYLEPGLYELRCYCTHCDRVHVFNYDSDIPLHIN